MGILERTDDRTRKKTYLDLVHMRRPHGRVPLHLLDVPHPVVTHPDAARLALLQQALQRAPHLLPLARTPAGRVDEEEVDEAARARVQLRHAVRASPVRLLRAARRREDLGCEEDVLPPETGFPHRGADLGLVLVVLRRVDVAVAVPQRVQARGHAHALGGQVDPEAEAGDPHGGVREREHVRDGEFGGHGVGGAGGWVLWGVVGFGSSAAFEGGLEGGGEGFVVGRDLPMRVSGWSLRVGLNGEKQRRDYF